VPASTSHKDRLHIRSWEYASCSLVPSFLQFRERVPFPTEEHDQLRITNHQALLRSKNPDQSAMPPKKATAAANKKAAEPKVKAESRTKATKAAAPTTKKAAKSTTPTLTNGVHTTSLRGKRKAEETAEAPKTNGVKRHDFR